MKKICLFVILVLAGCALKAQNSPVIKPYVDFIEEGHDTAKEYIFNLFEKYDIVIICERDHRDITQYDLFLDIFRDERFQKNIKNAYFEIGNNEYNDTLNSFLRNQNLTDKQVKESVLSFQRNSYGAPLWEKANYSYYLKGVYDINKSLPENNKISIHGLDIGINWSEAKAEDLKHRDSLIQHRDSIIGKRFLKYFKNQNTKKALVVLNYRHAFLKDMFGKVNAGRFISEAHKGRVANVLINSFVLTRNPDYPEGVALVHDGKWDASFIKAKKDNVGFDFAGSPFGNDSFDMIPFANDFKYSDIFTGYIYYRYFMDIKPVTGISGYIDDTFASILMKRYVLEQNIYNNKLPDIDKLKKEFNTVTDETYRKEFPHLENDIERWIKQ